MASGGADSGILLWELRPEIIRFGPFQRGDPFFLAIFFQFLSGLQASKQAGRKGARSKGAREQASKQAGSKGASNQAGREQGSKEQGSKQASKQAREQGSKQASKPGSKGAREQASKGASKQGSQQASKEERKGGRYYLCVLPDPLGGISFLFPFWCGGCLFPGCPGALVP